MTTYTNPLVAVFSTFVAFLPGLLAGLGLVVLGLVCGWLAKKILIQLAVLLRVDRLLSRSRWKEQLTRSDVRHGLYALVGYLGFVVVFLIFLDNAFIAWKLAVLSDLLRAGIVFLPRLLLAGAIFGAGWLLSAWTRRSVLKILVREGVQRPTLIARFVQSIPVLFFSAKALVELNVAKEIVIVGFTVVILTISALTIVYAIRQSNGVLREPPEDDVHNGREDADD